MGNWNQTCCFIGQINLKFDFSRLIDWGKKRRNILMMEEGKEFGEEHVLKYYGWSRDLLDEPKVFLIAEYCEMDLKKFLVSTPVLSKKEEWEMTSQIWKGLKFFSEKKIDKHFELENILIQVIKSDGNSPRKIIAKVADFVKYRPQEVCSLWRTPCSQVDLDSNEFNSPKRRIFVRFYGCVVYCIWNRNSSVRYSYSGKLIVYRNGLDKEPEVCSYPFWILFKQKIRSIVNYCLTKPIRSVEFKEIESLLDIKGKIVENTSLDSKEECEEGTYGFVICA